jgi:hypothetical protein
MTFEAQACSQQLFATRFDYNMSIFRKASAYPSAGVYENRKGRLEAVTLYWGKQKIGGAEDPKSLPISCGGSFYHNNSQDNPKKMV